MLLRLQNYSFDLIFKPGKEIIVADTLSRAFPARSAKQQASKSEKFDEEIANLKSETTEYPIQLIASDKTQSIILSAAQQDTVYSRLKEQIKIGWPDKPTGVPEELREYFPFCDELSVENDFVFKGSRLLVPAAARSDIISKSHSSHIGINSCIRRAREVVLAENGRRHRTVRQPVQNMPNISCRFTERAPTITCNT